MPRVYMSQRLDEVIQIIRAHGPLTADELAKHLGYKGSTVTRTRAIKPLLESGTLKSRRKWPSKGPLVYWCADQDDPPYPPLPATTFEDEASEPRQRDYAPTEKELAERIERTRNAWSESTLRSRAVVKPIRTDVYKGRTRLY